MFVTENGDIAEKDPKKPVTEQSELDEDFAGDPEGDDEEALDEEESEDGESEDEDSEEDASEDDGESEDEDSEEDEDAEEDADEEDANDDATEENTEGEPTDGTGGGKPAADDAEKRFKAQLRATLKALGMREVDTIEGLQMLAAEAKGVSLEEYQKESDEQTELQAARDLIRRAKEEEILTRDLDDIKRAFPFMNDLKSVRELPHLAEFGRLMDAAGGKISASEAFAATHADIIMKKTADAAKRKSLDGTKSHLHSSAPKGAKDDGVTMSKKELREWRELHPGKTDKEIIEIYKQSL